MKQLGYLINGIEFIPQHIAEHHLPFGCPPDQTIEAVWSLDDEQLTVDAMRWRTMRGPEVVAYIYGVTARAENAEAERDVLRAEAVTILTDYEHGHPHITEAKADRLAALLDRSPSIRASKPVPESPSPVQGPYAGRQLASGGTAFSPGLASTREAPPGDEVDATHSRDSVAEEFRWAP